MYSILIVDDESLVKISLQTIIQSHPEFTLVSSSSNGAEALEFYSNHPFDAMITDLQMPVMGGVELIRKLREKGFTGPILALSNYSDFELVRGAMKEGAFDYLLKADMKYDLIYEYLDRICDRIREDEKKRQTTYERERKDNRRNADLAEIAFRQYLLNADSEINEDLLLQTLPDKLFNCLLIRVTMNNGRLGPMETAVFLDSMLKQVLEDVPSIHIVKINDRELIAMIIKEEIDRQNIDISLRLTRFYRSVKAYSMQIPTICYAPNVNNLSVLKEAYQLCCQLEHAEITEDRPFTCIPDLGGSSDFSGRGGIKSEVLQILQYINSHMDDKLSLEDLSALVHLNREYLCRMFKKEMGKSLFQYIADLRMQKAAELIVSGNASIQVVAQTVGFQNPYVFSKRFKEYYGVSPQKYKNNPTANTAATGQ